MGKYIMAAIILPLLIQTSSCKLIEEAGCDSFDNVKYYQQNTINGMPAGTMVLNVQGSAVRSYPSDLSYILSEYNYYRELYMYECDINAGIDTDMTDYYHDLTAWYADQLISYYKLSERLLLQFDGVSVFRILLRPVDPSSSEPDALLLSITDLTVVDIGTEITLNLATPGRRFDIEYNGSFYTSMEAGSSLKLKIGNIRPTGEITQVEIISGSILYNDAGNMESVSISGFMNAYKD